MSDERVWAWRVDLYKRIDLAIRRYMERPPTDPEGKRIFAADVDELAEVFSEAVILASDSVSDILARFMYDAGEFEQSEVWGEFQGAARRELGADRPDRS